MYRLFSSMPIGLFIIAILCFVGIMIYGIIDMKKKHPGHPFVNVLYGFIVLGLWFIPHRIIEDSSLNQTVKSINDCVMMTLIAIFFIVFGYFSYQAYIQGYIDEKGKKLLKNTLLPCGIIFLICVIVIIVLYNLK